MLEVSLTSLSRLQYGSSKRREKKLKLRFREDENMGDEISVGLAFVRGEIVSRLGRQKQITEGRATEWNKRKDGNAEKRRCKK